MKVETILDIYITLGEAAVSGGSVYDIMDSAWDIMDLVCDEVEPIRNCLMGFLENNETFLGSER